MGSFHTLVNAVHLHDETGQSAYSGRPNNRNKEWLMKR